MLKVGLALAENNSLLIVGREQWLPQAGLNMNKGTRSKIGWALNLYLSHWSIERRGSQPA